MNRISFKRMLFPDLLFRIRCISLLVVALGVIVTGANAQDCWWPSPIGFYPGRRLESRPGVQARWMSLPPLQTVVFIASLGRHIRAAFGNGNRQATG